VCRPGPRSCSPAIPAPARRRLGRAPRPSSAQRCVWSWPRRSSRPTSRYPTSPHADPRGPLRPRAGRSAAARGGVPAHGARRGHGRRGAGPRRCRCR
jgi:hypothetical protein